MRTLTLGALVLLLLCAVGTRCEAQGVASSFEALRVLVMPGDRISVVDVTGREVRGRVGALSRDSVTLLTEAGSQTFGEVAVATIRQRHADSLTNGAIIGAVGATAYFLTGAALVGDRDGGEMIVSTAVAGGLLFAGMGAAAGAGIDALLARRRVIYQKPTGEGRVTVSPLFGRGRRGVALSVRL